MDRSFLVKHWLTTLISAPLLPTFYDLLVKPAKGESLGLLDIYPVILLFSFVLSIPTLILYYFLFSYFIKRQTNTALTKLVLITLTIVGIVTTILSIGGSMAMTLIYSFSISAAITGSLLRIKSNIGPIEDIHAVSKSDY